jgi:hypothetical protein
MSGKEAVRALRERGMQKPPTDFGPAMRTIAFALVAFMVGGGGVYGGVKLFSGGGAPSPGTAPMATVEHVALVTSVPAWTAARSISPVESCGMPCFSTSLCACVPLPAPGGPSNINLIWLSSPRATSTS